MTPRTVIASSLKITAAAGLLAMGAHALGWIAANDAQVARESSRAYCESVALWEAEAARGIAEHRRTGHPDYRDTAAEQCPGLRPAGNRPEAPNRSPERQLAQH